MNLLRSLYVYIGCEQLVDSEASGARVARGVVSAGRDPGRRRGPAAARDHESRAQLARRGRRGVATRTGIYLVTR